MLLALDTSTPLVTVALHSGHGHRARDSNRDSGSDRDGGSAGGDVVWERTATQPMRHGEQLAPLVDAALRETGTDRRDLTAIAVGTGPGPFTGLRVGLVTARTLGHVLGVEVHGVCSLDVLAVQAVGTAAVSEPFTVATDARRREVYLARYAADGTRLDGPVVDRPQRLATADPVVGEGGALYPQSFPHAREPLRPTAGWLARTVLRGRAALTAPEPLYLRRPDAALPGIPKRVS